MKITLSLCTIGLLFINAASQAMESQRPGGSSGGLTPIPGTPGVIVAEVTPNMVTVGDTLTVTMRIRGYSDPVEIDGFAFDVLYPSGMFTFVGSFDLGAAMGADQQWLSKPNQESVADGFALTSFNDGSTPGVAQIEMADLGFSLPERGTLAGSGFMVAFKLLAVGEGSGEIGGRPVAGPLGPEVLYDTNLRAAGVPQFLRSNVVVRPLCTNPPTIICPPDIAVWTCSNSTTVTYSPTATSPCCPNLIIGCTPPSGSPFAAGTVTPVTCTARDTCNNLQSSCTFTVAVRADTAPPVLRCPDDTRLWLCTNRTRLDYTVTATDDCDTNVAIRCTLPDGTPAPPGTVVPVPGEYHVTCTAVDDCGKTDICRFTIRLIEDTLPPVLNCPTNPLVVWTCKDGMNVDYGVTATDDCDTNVVIECQPPSGSFFLPGSYGIICRAIDDCGNMSFCQFGLRVIRDTEPPVITCPTNFTVWGCSNRIPVFYTVTATDDCDTSVDIRCMLSDGPAVPSGTGLPPGGHVIKCEARDDCGQSSSCSFIVRVIQDTEPPVIRCPTNIVKWVCTNRTTLDYEVTATDDCDTNVTIRCEPQPSTVAVVPGMYTVVCTATDDCGNQDRCEFAVRLIHDDVPPIISCPTNLVVWTCTNVWRADYGVRARDDCDTNVVIECIPPEGTPLQPGTHQVICRAVDDCGNVDRCEFPVRVIHDTQPPVISCPSNIVVRACYNCERVEFRAEARDDCDTNVLVQCEPPSGTCFPVGTNSVRCVAIDDCGNREECKFEIVVVKVPPPELTIRRAPAFDTVLNGFIVCWPATCPDFRLQSTRSLTPTAWENVTEVPELIASNWCVRLPNVPRQRFYRLFRPPQPPGPVITPSPSLNRRPNDTLRGATRTREP